MRAIQFIQFSPEELQQLIGKEVRTAFAEFKQHGDGSDTGRSEDYLTRKQVAKMLHIDLSTLHAWCRQGKLSPVGIGNRVYFLRSEIEKSMVRLNG